jgi:hypothetical protein
MLLPAPSRSVGVISQFGGSRGNPIPITGNEITRNSLCRQGRLNWRPLSYQAKTLGFTYWHFSDDVPRNDASYDEGVTCTPRNPIAST